MRTRKLILFIGLTLFGAILLSLAREQKTIIPLENKDLLTVVESSVNFVSEAPLERIEATSTELKGLIDKSKNTFAFGVSYTSFMGFNSALQREHFNENFMESDKYQKGTFSGRIIESVNWSEQGQYEVRVKGILDIHGIKQERMLAATIIVKKEGVKLDCVFPIRIADHNITIPKILNQKVAEEVMVTVSAQLISNDNG